MIMFGTRKISISMLVLASLALAQAPAPQPPAPQTAPQQPAQPPGPVLNLQDASLTEVVDQLARQLKINIQIDPRVKGTVTLNTYGETRNLDPRNLLDMILRVYGFGMVQEGEVYRIVPLADVIRQPVSGHRVADVQRIWVVRLSVAVGGAVGQHEPAGHRDAR